MDNNFTKSNQCKINKSNTNELSGESNDSPLSQQQEQNTRKQNIKDDIKNNKKKKNKLRGKIIGAIMKKAAKAGAVKVAAVAAPAIIISTVVSVGILNYFVTPDYHGASTVIMFQTGNCEVRRREVMNDDDIDTVGMNNIRTVVSAMKAAGFTQAQTFGVLFNNQYESTGDSDGDDFTSTVSESTKDSLKGVAFYPNHHGYQGHFSEPWVINYDDAAMPSNDEMASTYSSIALGGGHAIGMIQWDSEDRVRNLLGLGDFSYPNENWATIERQAAFIVWELTEGGYDGLESATTEYEAIKFCTQTYEGCAESHQTERLNDASNNVIAGSSDRYNWLQDTVNQCYNSSEYDEIGASIMQNMGKTPVIKNKKNCVVVDDSTGLELAQTAARYAYPNQALAGVLKNEYPAYLVAQGQFDRNSTMAKIVGKYSRGVLAVTTFGVSEFIGVGDDVESGVTDALAGENNAAARESNAIQMSLDKDTIWSAYSVAIDDNYGTPSADKFDETYSACAFYVSLMIKVSGVDGDITVSPSTVTLLQSLKDSDDFTDVTASVKKKLEETGNDINQSMTTGDVLVYGRVEHRGMKKSEADDAKISYDKVDDQGYVMRYMYDEAGNVVDEASHYISLGDAFTSDDGNYYYLESSKVAYGHTYIYCDPETEAALMQSVSAIEFEGEVYTFENGSNIFEASLHNHLGHADTKSGSSVYNRINDRFQPAHVFRTRVAAE